MVPFLVFLLRLPCRDGPLWIWCLASPAGVLTPRNPVLGNPRTFFRRVFGIFSRGRNAPSSPEERAAPQTLCAAGFPGNALIQSSRDFALGIPKEELAGRLANHGGQRISCRTHPDPAEPALSPDLESPHRASFIPKMEFPGRFLALLEIFVVEKPAQARRAPGLRWPSRRPSSTQGTQRAQRFRGFRRRRWVEESFLKNTERQRFAHPHARALRWNFGSRVYCRILRRSKTSRRSFRPPTHPAL